MSKLAIPGQILKNSGWKSISNFISLMILRVFLLQSAWEIGKMEMGDTAVFRNRFESTLTLYVHMPYIHTYIHTYKTLIKINL